VGIIPACVAHGELYDLAPWDTAHILPACEGMVFLGPEIACVQRSSHHTTRVDS